MPCNEKLIKNRYLFLLFFLFFTFIGFKGTARAQVVPSSSCSLSECGQNHNDRIIQRNTVNTSGEFLAEVIKPGLKEAKGNPKAVEHISKPHISSSGLGISEIVQVLIIVVLIIVIPLVIIPFILKNLPLLLGATGIDLSSTQKTTGDTSEITVSEENKRADSEDKGYDKIDDNLTHSTQEANKALDKASDEAT